METLDIETLDVETLDMEALTIETIENNTPYIKSYHNDGRTSLLHKGAFYYLDGTAFLRRLSGDLRCFQR